MKPQIRCYYWGENRPLVNLGDSLVPLIFDALGYTCVSRFVENNRVVNPGRCLLVIGSLLTHNDLAAIGYPVDVWGCGWKGSSLVTSHWEGMKIHAVRGPHSVKSLQLPSNMAVGDPALLLPHLVSLPIAPHGKTLVIPHCFRIRTFSASHRCAQTGCDEVLSPMILATPWRRTSWKTLASILYQYGRFGLKTLTQQKALCRIAGAKFVLTGSLHGAILAQAFGVPWAAYNDGYVNAPAKWQDWAAYLGIDIQLAHTLEDGETWWRRQGRHGKVATLGALLRAFPYEIINPRITSLANELD
ncbi:MAG TPA: hypothetical protein VJ440_08490 [Candidatus Brocadiaceae bacterium]|nr:hypothetical protein [Candidatus Brocadiaceae bacterium]